MRYFSKRQSGFSLLEVMLAVTVAIALGSMHLTQVRVEVEDSQAKAVGEQLKVVGQALNSYIAMQYGHIIAGENVIAPGAADDPGPRTCTAIAGGWECSISSDTLQRLGLVPSSFSGANAYGSAYEYFIRVQGVAPNWQVSGIVRTSLPYTAGGVVRYDLIGSSMFAAGADSGAVRTDVSRIDGLNGTWSETTFPAGQLGQLAYRAGYGTSGFSSYVRLDGTTPMTGNLDLSNHNLIGVDNLTASGEATASRFVTNNPRSDAIIVGASDAANRTLLGNNGDRLSIRNGGGVQILDATGTVGAPLQAGNINVGNVQSSGTGVFAASLQANGLSTTGGSNITSSGQISAIGDFTTTNGSFRTTNGSFITTNGNISAPAGTISAASLSVSGAATIGNNLTFNANGAGWFYDSATNVMALGNNANLSVGGVLTAGNIKANGQLEAGSFLKLTSVRVVGTACSAQTFAVDGNGALLQCVSGTYRNAGGINNVVTVNAPTAAAQGASSVATCSAGYKMVSGGYIIEQRLSYNDPTAPGQSFGDPSSNTWRIANPGDGNTATFRSQVVCVN